jgi:hypothetical protein
MHLAGDRRFASRRTLTANQLIGHRADVRLIALTHRISLLSGT